MSRAALDIERTCSDGVGRESAQSALVVGTVRIMLPIVPLAAPVLRQPSRQTSSTSTHLANGSQDR